MSTASYQEFRSLLEQRAFEDAVAFAEREIMRSGAPSSFWHTQLAIALIRVGRHVEAVNAADQALNIRPDDAFALAARAEALLAAGRWGDALTDFAEAEAYPRLKDRARRGMLNCLARMEDWSRLLARLSEWQIRGEAASFWRVKALVGLDQDDEAAAACRDWLEESPHNPRALWQLTELEVRRDGLETVLGRMGRLARIPSSPPVYGEIYASLCRKAGNSEAAIKQYDRLVAKAPDTRLQRKQAFALAKSGRELEAIPIIEELLRADPRDVYLHSSYGGACRRAGKLEQAHGFYEELITLHPEEKALYGRLRRIDKMLEGTGGGSGKAEAGPRG